MLPRCLSGFVLEANSNSDPCSDSVVCCEFYNSSILQYDSCAQLATVPSIKRQISRDISGATIWMSDTNVIFVINNTWPGIMSAHPKPTATHMPPVDTPVNKDMDFNPNTDFDLEMFEIPTLDSVPCGGPAISVSPFFTNFCKTKKTSSQTERRKLPKKLNLVHQHTSTSPTFQRDEAVLEKPTMVSIGTSLHVPYVDYYVIPLDKPWTIHPRPL